MRSLKFFRRQTQDSRQQTGSIRDKVAQINAVKLKSKKQNKNLDPRQKTKEPLQRTFATLRKVYKYMRIYLYTSSMTSFLRGD